MVGIDSRSGSPGVLADQTVEEGSPNHRAVSGRGFGVQWPQGQGQVGSAAIVMLDVLTQDPPQVTLAKDDQPIQCLVAERLDQPLTMSIRPRPPIGRERDPGALAAEHVVEVVDELGIPVVDEELDRRLQVL